MLRKVAKLAIPLGVLAIAVSVAGYLKATKPKVAAQPLTERVWTIAAIPAVVENIQPSIKLFGEIVSGRTVDLRPQVSGKIVQASPNLVEGGVVREGEVIVDVDPFDYKATLKQRQAELTEARGRLKELKAELAGGVELLKEDKAQLALRRKDANRRAKLRGSGAGTVKSSDDARLALSEAEQRQIDRRQGIQQLKASIEQQMAAIDRLEVAVSLAQRDLEETRIVSPSDGFVFSVETAEGKWLNVGDSVARLIDANRLEAKFHISRTQFRRLMAGGGYKERPAEIVWRGRAGGEPYSAYIDRVGSEVDATTGGVNLYAKIKTGGAETILRPGAFVEVYIADRIFERVVRVPTTAVYGHKSVYVVKDERLEMRNVQIESQNGGSLLISGAFEAGEMIATTRLPEVVPGLKVQLQ